MKTINLFLCALGSLSLCASDAPSMRDAIASGDAVMVDTLLYQGADPCEFTADSSSLFDAVFVYIEEAQIKNERHEEEVGVRMLRSLVNALFVPRSLSQPALVSPDFFFRALCSEEGYRRFLGTGTRLSSEILVEALLQYADACRHSVRRGTIGNCLTRAMGRSQSPTSVTEV
jgi:hypothetical protein